MSTGTPSGVESSAPASFSTAPPVGVAASVNWVTAGYVTAPKNQGQCGESADGVKAIKTRF
jgi:hypothetical protein